ncbi:MAG: sulfur oxidation c-type cytochrome SoxX [Burkholderiales bacterium]|nr:sulfur oxidation c-type cytochrome SoxX [Burkholderiales bacterium]
MHKHFKIAGISAACVALAGCATMMSDEEAARQALTVMKASFAERGQAKLSRLDRDDPQATCSVGPEVKIPREVQERIEKQQTALIKYPADGKFIGDWRQGERIAQSGVGMQFTDNPANPAGGNCYACHQMSPQEISFGTIGPPLLGYGKLRGNSEAIQRYTFGKIYNAQAYNACSTMPRFGHNRILTEEQIKHLTALLLDPASPVNQ